MCVHHYRFLNKTLLSIYSRNQIFIYFILDFYFPDFHFSHETLFHCSLSLDQSFETGSSFPYHVSFILYIRIFFQKFLFHPITALFFLDILFWLIFNTISVIDQNFSIILLQTILKAYISIYRTRKSMPTKSTTDIDGNLPVADTQEGRLYIAWD